MNINEDSCQVIIFDIIENFLKTPFDGQKPPKSRF